MECDDLKSVITRYQEVAPNIPPNQVHMVMWERRLTPEHTLVMKDTEDTKYLASLVLSVQQPASSQTTTEASNRKFPAFILLYIEQILCSNVCNSDRLCWGRF